MLLNEIDDIVEPSGSNLIPCTTAIEYLIRPVLLVLFQLRDLFMLFQHGNAVILDAVDNVNRIQCAVCIVVSVIPHLIPQRSSSKAVPLGTQICPALVDSRNGRNASS